MQSILDQYVVVFKEDLGALKNFTAKIYVDPTVKPQFFKVRPVPYALRSQNELELDRLVEKGIITPISFSEWAASILPIMKNDKTIRICGDFRVTLTMPPSWTNIQFQKWRIYSHNCQDERPSLSLT